jgi:hypothetical protein
MAFRAGRSAYPVSEQKGKAWQDENQKINKTRSFSPLRIGWNSKMKKDHKEEAKQFHSFCYVIRIMFWMPNMKSHCLILYEEFLCCPVFHIFWPATDKARQNIDE